MAPLKCQQNLAQFIKHQMWLDYDGEVDVLYLHFENSAVSTHSEMREDGIVLDYKGNQLVGLTILEASKRISENDSITPAI